jgi:predicted small lipoprotein YifL
MKMAGVGAAILAALIGLSACGQRGPLYLPAPPAPPAPAADSQQAAPKPPPQDGARR